MPRPKTAQRMSPSIPVRFHEETLGKIRTASGKVKMSEQDVIRQSVEIGLPALVNALTQAKASSKAA